MAKTIHERPASDMERLVFKKAIEKIDKILDKLDRQDRYTVIQKLLFAFIVNNVKPDAWEEVLKDLFEMMSKYFKIAKQAEASNGKDT